jgi:hypothetical protein
MEVKELGPDSSGRVATVEVDYRQIAYRRLKRHLRRFRGVEIKHSLWWPMTNDCLIYANTRWGGGVDCSQRPPDAANLRGLIA